MALTTEDLTNIKHLFDDRFDHIDTRLDGIDARLDGIDTRLDGIDERLDNIDTHLDHIDLRLDGHDQRFIGIDQQFAAVHTSIDRLATATKVQFDEVLTGLGQVKDDVAVIKDIVKDHGFRLTRLEHHVFGPAQ